MRTIIAVLGLTAVLALGGCAAAVGQAAGYAIGGAAKGGLFAGKVGVKGAKLAGRTVYGAAKGVHEEFSRPNGGEPEYVKVSEEAVKASQH